MKSANGVAGWLILSCVLLVRANLSAEDVQPIKPSMEMQNPSVKDQDDLCIWRDSTDSSRSTIIASDKSANFLFVYDLEGKLIQEVSVPKPGNVDIRQHVLLGGEMRDLVVVNQRAPEFRLCVYAVDSASRKLQRLDKDQLLTGPNYGGCLYHSRRSGRLYAICTSDKGTVEQYELSDDEKGGILSNKVRSWPLGKCEGAVAADESGDLYISEEGKGVWKLGAESEDPTPGELILEVGKNGMKGDVEGLAIVEIPGHGGVLLVSDQRRSRFVACLRNKPYSILGEFAVEGVNDTDGLEVTAAPLGSRFPQGIFACHTDRLPRGIIVTAWQDVLASIITPNAPK